MEIWVYGAGKQCSYLLKKLDRYPSVQPVGLADSFVTGDKYGYHVVDLLADGRNIFPETTIVIALVNVKYAVSIAKNLHRKGYSNVYWYLGKTKSFTKDFIKGECIKIPCTDEPILPSLELHVTDFCNLNCAACAHFSPLYPHELPDFRRRFRDVEQVSKMFQHIVLFSLLGGEPLLNHEISRYMEEARRCLPDTEIQLITNGLLIPQMKDDFFEAARRNRITLVVSEYKPTHDLKRIIIDKLERYHIDYTIREQNEKMLFNRSISICSDSIHAKGCISDGCVSVCDGRIARCPTLLYLRRFNEYFQQELPEEGVFELSDCGDAAELLRIMEERVPLCDYCIKDEIVWHSCGAHPCIEDFAALD